MTRGLSREAHLISQSLSCEAHLISQSLSCEAHLVTQSLSCEENPTARECEEESPAFLFDEKRASFMSFRIRPSAATTCVHFAGPRDFHSIFVPGGRIFAGLEAVYQR
jgi:hypothetical protein